MIDEQTEIADFLRLKLASINLTAQTLAQAEDIIAASPLNGKDALKRLRREWMNDVLQRDDMFGDAIKSPNAKFLTWISTRVRDPFHVTYRAAEKAARLYSPEFANLMHFVRWRQEVAWAERMRGDDNDRIAVLSFLFFTSSTADPAKAFLGLCESYMLSMSAGGTNYVNHPNHRLTPDQILAGEGEQGWVPLFVGYAERTVGRQLVEMPPARFAKLAAHARNEERAARRRRSAAGIVARIRQSPMSRLPGLIFEAVRYRLGSNDLVALENAFLLSVEQGEVELNGSDPYPAFLRYLQAHSGDRMLPPEDSEAMRRIASIRTLNNEWLSGLSSDLKQFGGGDGRVLAKWRMQVMRGDREAPVDPLVDYAFFLIERVTAGDAGPL